MRESFLLSTECHTIILIIGGYVLKNLKIITKYIRNATNVNFYPNTIFKNDTSITVAVQFALLIH